MSFDMDVCGFMFKSLYNLRAVYFMWVKKELYCTIWSNFISETCGLNPSRWYCYCPAVMVFYAGLQSPPMRWYPSTTISLLAFRSQKGRREKKKNSWCEERINLNDTPKDYSCNQSLSTIPDKGFDCEVWRLTVSEYQSVVREGHFTYVFKVSFMRKLCFNSLFIPIAF